MSRIEHAERAAQEYKHLEDQGANLALKFALIFVGIAVLLLLAAVLGGFLFANKLSKPMRHLIRASEEVSRGNLSFHIPEEEGNEEFSSLISAYNHMTTQLESQRQQLEGRRRFTEAVLSGVSSGIIGLDSQGKIHLPNFSASKLLGIDFTKRIGKKLVEVVPEMKSLFQEIKETRTGFVEKQVVLTRKGHSFTFLVRLSRDKQNEYVLTFDDITQLQLAQRKAAWSDIARRIAHEIKNPLTPIQLSAERLKRRFTPYITQDSDIFKNCIDTIMRQVSHIGQLVGEFSAFARMPAPELVPDDLVQICREELALQHHIYPDIKINFTSSLKKLPFRCDRSQMSQVLTNLIQNAALAIEAKPRRAVGQIKVSLKKPNESRVELTFLDNGMGLPSEGRERLTEPYVTFHEKGTGLGLAIVKKIVEDHGGSLSFHDNPKGGAMVQLTFPLKQFSM